MLQIRSWPEIILHLDADSFFTSVAQSLNPTLKGKPVVTGGERGVVTSLSPEAKRLGVTRTIPIFKLRIQFPQVIVVNTNYEMCSLYSHRIFEIMRQYSPVVEEYSVDEGFADLKGLRRPLGMCYEEIARTIKINIEKSLGITVSVGVANTKSLAKLASSFQKPSGLTMLPGGKIEKLLAVTPIEKVWGIGPNTASYLQKFGILTAFDFVKKPEAFIHQHLSKPFFEIWRELRGEKVYGIDPSKKTTYFSITRSQTFYPPTNDKTLLWSRLLGHVEEAFEQARRLNYRVQRVNLYLKSQEFKYFHQELVLATPASYPMTIRKLLEETYDVIWKSRVRYRSAGCTITHLTQETSTQATLFDDNLLLEEKAKKIYPLFEQGKVDFGSRLFEKRVTREKKIERMTTPLVRNIPE